MVVSKTLFAVWRVYILLGDIRTVKKGRGSLSMFTSVRMPSVGRENVATDSSLEYRFTSVLQTHIGIRGVYWLDSPSLG